MVIYLGCYELSLIVQMLISFCLGRFPGARWLGHIKVSFSGFWGISMLYSIMIIAVYTPSNSGLGYLSLTSLWASIVFWFLDSLEWSQISLFLLAACSSWLVVLKIFSCLCVTYISTFENCQYISFTHFLIELFTVLLLIFLNSL